MRNRPSAHEVLRSISRRGLMLAALLALSLETVGPTATLAAPAAVLTSYTLRVSPASLRLCVGQTVNVTVTANRLTRRSAGTRAARRPARDGWVTVQAAGAVASVAAPGGPPPRSLTVRAVSRGTEIVHLDYYDDDPDSPLVPLVPGQAPIAPTRRTGTLLFVEVIDPCSFDLFVTSTGTRRKGFVERMTSKLTATITPDPTTGEFSKEVDVVNRITQRQPIRSICVSGVRALASDATVEGKLDPQTGTLNLKVSFGDISVDTTYVCPRAAGGSPGTAQPKPFEPSPIDISLPSALAATAGRTAAGTFTHTVYTDIRIQNRGTYRITVH